MVLLVLAPGCSEPTTVSEGLLEEESAPTDSASTDSGTVATAGDTAGDTATDSPAPTDSDATNSPPCDWADLPRPHWSVAIPWLLADPALSTGIELGDTPYTETVVGDVASDGGFRLAITPRPDSAFAAFTVDGTFDAETGSGAWTLGWETLAGDGGSQSVSAAWEGCELVERYDAQTPGLDHGISSERRTLFGSDGTAHAEGTSLDPAYEACENDTYTHWTSAVSVAGDALVVGYTIEDGAWPSQEIVWTLVGNLESPDLDATVQLDYGNCFTSHGPRGVSEVRWGLTAGDLQLEWYAEANWYIFDGLGAWYADGSASVSGQGRWGEPASVWIAYDDERSDSSTTTEDSQACAGQWDPVAGLSWECEVDTYVDHEAWGVPPALGLWGP